MIFRRAFFTVLDKQRSSLTAVAHNLSSPSFLNVSVLIAIEPPHAWLNPVLPSICAILPFIAERTSDARLFLLGTNHRYPVEAP